MTEEPAEQDEPDNSLVPLPAAGQAARDIAAEMGRQITQPFRNTMTEVVKDALRPRTAATESLFGLSAAAKMSRQFSQPSGNIMADFLGSAGSRTSAGEALFGLSNTAKMGQLFSQPPNNIMADFLKRAYTPPTTPRALAGVSVSALMGHQFNQSTPALAASMVADRLTISDAWKVPTNLSAIAFKRHNQTMFAGLTAPIFSVNLGGRAAADYAAAVRSVYNLVGVTDTEPSESDLAFIPSADDDAFEALVAIAPELADSIEEVAGTVQTPFWNRRAIRNSLAGIVYLLIVTLYVAGTCIPIVGNVAVGLAGSHGLTANGAYKRIAISKPDADSEPEDTE